MKKNLWEGFIITFPFKQLFKKKSIALTFVLWSSFLFIQPVMANQRISLSLSNVSLEKAIKTVEEKTPYVFFLNNSDIDLSRTVSLNVDDTDIRIVVQTLLPGYQYRIEEYKIIILPAQSLNSDKRKITGTIKDISGWPVIGANIMLKLSSGGAVTDIDGNFSLEVSDGNTMVISYIGYLTQEIRVDQRDHYDILLKEDTQLLDEVVIVGFGAQKKANLTGAVSQVKMDDVLGNRPVINAMSALQGVMPGLQITPNSNNTGPGQFKSFNIRGTNSINGGEPLVLIDNVPGDIDMINPEDIESVSILKDAASSAIYGARAAFGVILITTKKGQRNHKFTLNYNNNFGFQKSINRPNQADALDFLYAYKDAGFLSGSYFAGQNIDKWIGYLQEYRANPGNFNITGDGIYIPTEDNPAGTRYYLNDKDLYKNMLDNYGFLQTHSVSASGGTEKLIYRLSLGFNEEQGILITDKDSYKRISVGSYISADITDWLTQSVDIRYGRSRKSMPNDVAGGLYGMRLSNLTPDGDMELPDGTVLPTNTPRNILLNAPATITHNENPRIVSVSTFKPFKGLTAVLEYTYDKKVYDQKEYNDPYWFTSIQLGKARSANTSEYINTKRSTNHNALNVYATYDFSLNQNHNFKVMGGFNQESSRREELKVTRLEMINENLPSFSSATGETTAVDNYKLYSVRGAFYRFNYDYKNKYLLEANGRYDGSSKFPSDSRFGFFPSFSAGWNVANESFMQKLQHSFLDELKLRVSWGQIGNQAIDPYAFTPTMEAEKAYWIYDGSRPTTLKVPGLVSSNFTWEKVQTLNMGIDLGLFNSRFHLTYDKYIRDTKDMLTAGIELPSVVGTDAPMQNVADLRTKGWELSLSWRDRIGSWGYNVGVNLYDSRTKVTKFNNESGLFYDRNEAQTGKRYREGMYIGEIWGYVSDGFYTIDDFENTTTWQLKEGVPYVQGVTVKPGDVKYKNLRDDENSVNRIDSGDDTVENPGDKTVIGNSQARYQFGITGGVNWKGFDLFILLQGTGKRDIWRNDDRRWAFNSGEFGTIFDDQLDYWQPRDWENGDYTAINPDAKYFRIYNQRENSGYNTRIQTQYLMKAAYLRIKNITLAYSVPPAFLSKYSVSALRLFVTGENLGTFTSLPKGYDPERIEWGYPVYRTISFGLTVTL